MLKLLNADQLPGFTRLELTREQPSLPVRESSDLLGLRDVVPGKELAAPGASPAPLTEQQVSNSPAADLLRRVEDDVCHRHVTHRDPPLELRPGEPYLIGSPQCPQSLRLTAHRGGLRHSRSLSLNLSARCGRLSPNTRSRTTPTGMLRVAAVLVCKALRLLPDCPCGAGHLHLDDPHAARPSNRGEPTAIRR